MSLINCNPDENPTYLSPLIGDLVKPSEWSASSVLSIFLTDAVCDSWEDITEVPHLPPGTDAGCVLSTRLQQMPPRTVKYNLMRKSAYDLICDWPQHYDKSTTKRTSGFGLK